MDTEKHDDHCLCDQCKFKVWVDPQPRVCKSCQKAESEAVPFHNKKILCVECERKKGRADYKLKKAREKARKRKFEERRTPMGMLKALAHKAVKQALKEGTLEKPLKCQRCFEDEDVQGHHVSYEKRNWLKVRWLCRSCHAKADEERRKLEEAAWHLTEDGVNTLCLVLSHKRIHISSAGKDLDEGTWCEACNFVHKK